MRWSADTQAAAARWRPLLGLALVLAACGGGEPRRVVLVGDSITWGLVSEPAGPSWATQLAERLEGEALVVNLACGGTTSRDWTRSRGAVLCQGEGFLPSLYEARVRPALPADVVVVLLGTNDASRRDPRRRVPAEEYGANLRELADTLRADGAARVVLLTPPLVTDPPAATLQVARYREQIRALCEARDDVVCGPDLLALLRAADFAPRDLHPNGAGHAKIADATLAALQPLL